MRCSAVLLHLILWTSTAHAFFPWFPPSVCAHDNELCKSQADASSGSGAARKERSLPAEARAAAGVTFRIGRRAPAHPVERHEPLKDKVERVASRLAKKFAAGAAVAPAVGRSAVGAAGQALPPTRLARRTNAFSISTAATPTASNALGIDQDGTDFSYFVQTNFGSAGTPMLMLLDTGAGTTWVMGSNCQSSACTIHSAFGAADSTSLQMSSDTFSIAYGSGAVAGNLASDTVRVAALAMTMSFGIANTTSADFTHFPFDGILGLSLSEGVTDNFMKSAKKAKLLPANVFGVSLWRAEDGGGNTGEIVFGGTDSTKYTGSIAYTPVAAGAGGDWAIAMDDMGYDGVKAGITGRRAYIDTGTTYVFGPSSDVAALHAQIPGAASSDGGVTYTVPCTSSKPLTVFFSGVAYSISALDWLSSPDSSGNCTSNIYGHAVVADAWLLGDLFIKNVYAVFDADDSRIGFADKPAPSQTPSSSSTIQTVAAPSSTKASSGGFASGVPAVSAVAPTTTSPASGSASGGGTGTLPGLSGHETSATALAESTTGPAPKTTAIPSPADRLEGGVFVSLVCVVAALAVAV